MTPLPTNALHSPWVCLTTAGPSGFKTVQRPQCVFSFLPWPSWNRGQDEVVGDVLKQRKHACNTHAPTQARWQLGVAMHNNPKQVLGAAGNIGVAVPPWKQSLYPARAPWERVL